MSNSSTNILSQMQSLLTLLMACCVLAGCGEWDWIQKQPRGNGEEGEFIINVAGRFIIKVQVMGHTQKNPKRGNPKAEKVSRTRAKG